MKILLVSDTHGRTKELGILLESYKDRVEMVCHMGDYGKDLMKFESSYRNLKMNAVTGNTDFTPYGQTEKLIEVCAKNGKMLKLLVTHGHKFGVKRGLDRLVYYAKEIGANAVFFGHTHEDACFFVDGIFVVNPGSLTFGRVKDSTYAIVTVTDDGEFEGELLKYDF